MPSSSSSQQCLSTLLMLVTSDMYTLINYVGFINYLFYGVTVAGQIVLRWKKPDIPRPIKVRGSALESSIL
jgi:L-type amino acid transporter 8